MQKNTFLEGIIMENQSNAPVGQLKTNRALVRFILLSIVTFGIYALVFWYCIAEDINAIASRHDGKKTMNYALLVFLIAPITFGIGVIVWFHRLSNRVGNELSRRSLGLSFSSSTYWGWFILGSLLFGIGPLVYLHKLSNAMNALAEDYNTKG
jgi:NADH:ubiquinone oxidoreductase subunit 5 (subunit L)/multisubunit Na+/H+ antiporter MnhA subunit